MSLVLLRRCKIASVATDESMPAPAAPPVLGQHTDAVLAQVLGLDAEAIAELRGKGAVA